MAWKLKRKRTRETEERIKALEDRMSDAATRLDAAVAESRRLAKAMDELSRNDPMRDLRKVLKKRFGPPQAGEMGIYDPDDPVH